MLGPLSPRPQFERANPPPPMRFQERDGWILQAISAYDGVLARRHLKAMFWPSASWQALERRLSLLYHNHYLDWPSRDDRRTKPIPEPIAWLGWRGALFVAGQTGVAVDAPANARENQLRLLDSRLRRAGFMWQRSPRWMQLRHDLAVIDFRMLVEHATSLHPSLHLEEWIPEGHFRSQIDVVEYRIRTRNGRGTLQRKGVRPDGYFAIDDRQRQIKGSPARARFLLELDMATHPNPRFGSEKALPGAAYIRSPAYKARFGFNSGRWLVVTTGRVRMSNLMKQTEQAIGQRRKLFLFTTFEQVFKENVLAAPLWWQTGKDTPLALFPAAPQ